MILITKEILLRTDSPSNMKKYEFYEKINSQIINANDMLYVIYLDIYI